MENNKRQGKRLDDPFSKFMFGEKKLKSEPLQEESSLEKTISKHLEGVDVDELLKTIDLFMTTTTQLKPLFNKVSPYIMQLVKKGGNTK